MSIVINAAGTSAAEGRYEFTSADSPIVVGRADGSAVQFPADDTRVSRTHVTLTWRHDRYYVEMQADNPVFVDGKQVFSGDELPMGASVMTLGKADGPALSLTITSEAPDMLATDPNYKAAPTARGQANKAVRYGLIAVGLVAVVAVASMLFFRAQSDNFSEQIAALEAEDEALAATVNAETLVREKRESVYLVAAEFKAADGQPAWRGVGTAFAIGPGLLATNAHVIEGVSGLLKQRKYTRAVVISNQPPYDRLPIKRLEMHPLYKIFEARQTNALVRADDTPLKFVPGYDVGIMEVADVAADRLAKPLTIASMDTIQSLDSGAFLAYIGYPMETAAAGGLNPEKPVPQLQSGAVTSVTDFFVTADEPDQNHLVQHNLPLSGGASGSPVFDQEGNVVALISAANLLALQGPGGVQRVSSGIGVNFAQRADLLQELLDGTADEKIEARKAFWGERLARFRSPLDLVVDRWRVSAQSVGLRNVKTLVSENAAVSTRADNKGFYTHRTKVDLRGARNARLFFGALSLDGQDINQYIFLDGILVFKNVKKDNIPVTSFDLKPNRQGRTARVAMVVVTGKAGTEFSQRIEVAKR